MEARLLAFAVLVILLGGFTGNDYITIFGFILIFPALLIPSGRTTPKKVEQKQAQPRRITPPQPTPAQVVPAAQMPTAKPEAPMPSSPSYSVALFPNTMFPSISPAPATSMPTSEAKRATPPEPRDELLELGFLYAVVRLLAG